MQNNNPNQNVPSSPGDEKAKLEIEKLNEEIKELSKKWYRKPQYISAILPTLIATVSLIGLFLNGNFETKSQQLQLKKERLEFENIKFEAAVKNTHDSLLVITDSLSKRIISLKDSLFGLNNKSLSDKKSRDSADRKIKDLLVQLQTNQSNTSKSKSLIELSNLFSQSEKKLSEYMSQVEFLKQEIHAQKDAYDKLRFEKNDIIINLLHKLDTMQPLYHQ